MSGTAGAVVLMAKAVVAMWCVLGRAKKGLRTGGGGRSNPLKEVGWGGVGWGGLWKRGSNDPPPPLPRAQTFFLPPFFLTRALTSAPHTTTPLFALFVGLPDNEQVHSPPSCCRDGVCHPDAAGGERCALSPLQASVATLWVQDTKTLKLRPRALWAPRSAGRSRA